MKNMSKWVVGYFLTNLITLTFVEAQQPVQPYYPSGQAVFVQQPYNSSVYTDYNYNPNRNVGNRLPNYTTNQAVFVQQPYGAQQTVAPYPTRNRYNRSSTESNYATPQDYPSTTTQAYPFATVRSYTASPYSTTVQYPTYNYTTPSATYTSTQTYPYNVTKQAVPAPTSQDIYYPSRTYRPYTTYPYTPYPSNPAQSPYPLQTALPEIYTQPAPGQPVQTQVLVPMPQVNR